MPSRVGIRMPPFPFTPMQPMPTTALEHPVLPEMKEDVMSQDPSTAYLMAVLDNELEKKSFVELASSGIQAGEYTVMQFKDGLRSLRLLVTSQENHMDGLIHYHEMRSPTSIDQRRLSEPSRLARFQRGGGGELLV